MEVIKTIKELRNRISEFRKEGNTIGFVPTMGYLHEGHASLIKRSIEENTKTIVSIFLNPIQFAPSEDLDAYPRDFEHDCKLCDSLNADLIFYPEVSEMYADDFCTYVDMNTLTTELCGKTRPTHFRGVCTVVSKLFHIVTPDKAYFGQKDAQQLAVIRRMVRDLNMNLEIIGCPIVREADGLAKSSRNTYLNENERAAALVLSKSILLARRLIADGELNAAFIIKQMRELIEQEPLAKIDYIDAVDGITMQKTEYIHNDTLIALAVYIGKTRLIDNCIVTLP